MQVGGEKVEYIDWAIDRTYEKGTLVKYKDWKHIAKEFAPAVIPILVFGQNLEDHNKNCTRNILI